MIAAKNAKVAKVDWKTVKLGEVLEFKRGYDLPHAQMVKGQYPVIGSSGILGWHNEYTTETPSITIGRSGSVGRPYLYNGRSWSHNTALYIKDFKGNDPYYLYYLLFSVRPWEYGGGSAVPTLNRNDLHGIMISLPPLPTQRKIAAVLGALDDKIENNRKICANLEAQAQALFKSWFVDFEPFGGKMPKDWKMEPLQECINFQEGPGIRNWQYVEKDGTKFINIRCIVDHDIKIATANMISNEEANGKYAHFMLHEYDIIMSCSGTLGRFAIVRKCHLPLCLNTSVIRFYPKGCFEHFSWLYGYLGSDDFLLQQEALANGSVQANFGPTHLKGMKVRMPSDDALARYHSIVFPLIKKELSLLDESSALAELRDALLPKLMSGELDVDDVEV